MITQFGPSAASAFAAGDTTTEGLFEGGRELGASGPPKVISTSGRPVFDLDADPVTGAPLPEAVFDGDGVDAADPARAAAIVAQASAELTVGAV
jgi:hypothetical protein